MKTKTDFRKTAVRTAAVVVSFVLVSFTVSAQDFWKKLLTNSSFNEIAIAMVEPAGVEPERENSKNAGAEWKSFDMAFDPALELEGWMASEQHFGVDVLKNGGKMNASGSEDFSLLDLSIIADSNEPLELEAWMVQDGMWMK